MQATVDRLAELGIDVDASRFRVRSADEPELRRAIELENIAALGESWFELQRVLDLAAGLTVPADAAGYCAQWHARLPVQPGLNYISGSDQLLVHPILVMTSDGYAQAMVREMYRAYDDQKVDVREREKRIGTTTEAVLVARAWGNGHAELAMMRALGIQQQIQPTPLEQRLASSALHSRCAVQWLSTDSAAAVPPSSEQLLHPAEKRGEIGAAIPPIAIEKEGLALLRDDQVGELGLRMLLSRWGVDPLIALPAGIGWDGDRLALRIGKDGARVLQARICFDRELDAQQWEAALRPIWKGSLRRRGAMVDMAWASSADLQIAAEAALNNSTLDAKSEEAKARSTELVEARLLNEQPSLASGAWVVPEQSFTLVAGNGWKQIFEDGRVALERGEQRLRLSVMPTPGKMTGKDLLAAVEATLKQTGSVVSGKAEATAIDGRDAVRLEYTLKEQDKTWAYREVQVPGEQLKLVLTLRSPEGPCEGCDDLLKSLRFGVFR